MPGKRYHQVTIATSLVELAPEKKQVTIKRRMK
jgi:hypothetical protein